MDLRIIYGWHLDGPSFPEHPPVGTVALGPVGFVAQLALRLGLTMVFPHTALRIATYSSILRALDDGNKFYSKSFSTDAWGTARALIHLRDELVGAGWDSRQSQPASNRLQTLAEIENNSGTPIAQFGDLVLPIAKLLEAGSRVPITHVGLIDGESALPPIHRRVIRALSSAGVAINDYEFTAPAGHTDVANLARNLALLQRVDCTVAGDGSFHLVESDDELQAADFTAELLRSSLDRGTVVIRGSDTSLLDRLLHQRSMPILGGASQSPLRGAIQLLPLTFELCWNPVDPMQILEFLTSPYSPVPNFAGDCFAYAIRGEPGIGGSAWSNAWNTALARKRKALENARGEPSEIEESLVQAERTWKDWLEPPRFDPTNGIDALHAVATCKRLRQYALKMQAVQQNSIFGQLAAYADTLASTLELSRLSMVPKVQLNRMIESVVGSGCKSDEQEASDWSVLAHPGQLFAPAENVVWWGFNHTLSPPRPSAWTSAELTSLSSQGVHIERPAHAIAREAKSWRRPFVVGCSRIILVKPRTAAGVAAPAHPFFHEISGVIDSSPSSIRAKIVSQANQIYEESRFEVSGCTLAREKVTRQSLPSAHRIWNISPSSVPLRIESPSSVERLLGCPLNWLLRFASRIRPGNLISVAHGDQLAGNLAHAVFASLFSDIDSLSDENIANRAELIFDELCPKVAATLLLPGNSLERLRLKRSLSEAAAHLFALVRNAGFKKVECESQRQAQYQEIQFTGRTDMFMQQTKEVSICHKSRRDSFIDMADQQSERAVGVMQSSSIATVTENPLLGTHELQIHNDFVGQDYAHEADAVIDLKWARRGVYRRREIEEGRAVQLAMYAWMCGEQTHRPTTAAYYMLRQKQLFSTSRHSFPEYTYVDGPGLDHTFTRVIESYLVHLRNLADGTIYATGIQDATIPPLEPPARYLDRVVHDESTEALSPVPGVSLVLEPPCRFCEYGRLCGKKELST